MISNSLLFLGIPVFLMGILALLSKIMQKSWFAPGPFFALYWFVFTTVPLIAAPDYPVHISGVYWILISSLAVVSGSLITLGYGETGHSSNGPSRPRRHVLKLPFLNILIIFSFVFGMLAPVVLLKSQGHLNLLLFSIGSIMNVARKFSVMRYLEGWSPPVLSRFFTTWIYVGALLCGVRLITAKSFKERAISFSPFVPALIMTVLLTTKASILFTILLFVATAIATKVHINHGRINLSFLAKPGLYGLLFLIPLIFMADILRGGKANWTLGAVWEHLKPSFFGYLAAFAEWFGNNWSEHITPQFGAFSIAGLFDALGIHQRVQGLYFDVSSLEAINSNVYTIFRGLIQDFTLTGSLLVLFISGMISGVAYRLVVRGESFFIPILACFYALTLWSFVVSPLNYNSIIFAFLFMQIYFGVALCLEPDRGNFAGITSKKERTVHEDGCDNC